MFVHRASDQNNNNNNICHRVSVCVIFMFLFFPRHYYLLCSAKIITTQFITTRFNVLLTPGRVRVLGSISDAFPKNQRCVVSSLLCQPIFSSSSLKQSNLVVIHYFIIASTIGVTFLFITKLRIFFPFNL